MNTYKMTLEDSVDSMTFDLLEVPIVDKDVEGAVDNTTLDGNIFTDYLWLKKNYVQKWSIMCDDEYSRLRGFYTRQFDNASVPTYKLFYGENISQDQAISGDYILVNNPTDRNAPITSFELLGDATQTTYSGKNLLKYPSTSGSQTIFGVQFTQSADGKLVGSGTTTGGMNWYYYGSPNYFVPTESGQYTLSFTGQHNNMTLYCYDRTTSQVAIRVDSSQSSSQATGMLTAGHEYQIYFNQGASGVSVSINGYGQLEKGSTATAYEPYVGGIASPNPDYPQPVNTVTGEQTVKITGKNLCSSTSVPVATQVYFNFDKNTITAGTYTLSTALNEATANNTVSLLIDGTATNLGTFAGSAGATVKTTFTLSAAQITSIQGSTTSLIRLYKSGASFTNPAWAQLELGSTATTYEPYQGQEFEVNLGKNLIQNTLITEPTEKNGVTATPNADGTFTLNGTATANGYFNFYRDGTILTASTYVTDIGSTIKSATTGNFTYSASITNGRIYSLAYDNSNRYWFFVTKSGETYNNAILKIQCEAGTSATSYAPYFTPIELAKIGNYQDRIYKEDSKWYIEKQVGKVVYDGSETWSMAANGNSFFRTLLDATLMPNRNTIAYAMSNYYTAETYNRVTTATPVIDYGLSLSDSTNRINIRNKDITTIADFQAWLSTHPTTVYYALATPTTTEITNSELVGQLEAILQAYLYTGTNNVSNNAVSPNLAGQMNLGYKLIFSEETVLIEPTAVRLTLTDGGIINVCGCRQNVQLTMRETIQ